MRIGREKEMVWGRLNQEDIVAFDDTSLTSSQNTFRAMQDVGKPSL